VLRQHHEVKIIRLLVWKQRSTQQPDLSQILSLFARRVVPLINSGDTREQVALNRLTAKEYAAGHEIQNLRLLDEGDEVYDFGAIHATDPDSEANV
jgi:hypothetical protein